MYPLHHCSATGVVVKRKNEKCKEYVRRLAGGAHHCRKPCFSGAVVAKATDQAKTDSSTTKNTEKKNADVAPAQKKNPGWLPSRKERMSAAFPLRKKRGTPKHCQRSFAMVARAQRECFSKAHFSRKMTSPWPTSWSFNHKRYL